jgi:hypothetical protein
MKIISSVTTLNVPYSSVSAGQDKNYSKKVREMPAYVYLACFFGSEEKITRVGGV